ncbi:hypothetical protein [Salinimicrobium flavum]|uniref:Zinc-finger domain-containing protein n=1 Tax=Salinimicrobium flavum TaxID=1737065 RepID=A0ABW5J119_9FLAO
MSIMRFFGLDCAEAASACHKAEYNEAGLVEKLRLKLHLFLCTPCKDYNQKNHKLSHLIKKANLHSCSEEEKEAYRQRINEQRSETSR